MGEERIELEKLNIVLFQSLAVLFSAYIVSLFKDAEYTSQTIAILYLLHFVSFYISNIAYRFYSRGYLDELFQVLKYNVFFAVGITFTSFMLDGVFSISRRGMIYFFLFNTFSVYIMDLLLKRYRKSVSPRRKSSRKIFLITATSRMEKVFDILHSPSLYHGELIGVTVMDDTDFTHSGVRVVQPDQMMNFVTKEVVDEVFINLPSEDYNISDFVSEFESMGIDVSVNLNAFNFASLGNKRVREVGGLSVVTFSTNFYKPSHVFAKRLLDIVGALFGLLICGLVSIVLVPLIRKDGGPAFFVQKRVGKNGRYFYVYKFRSMYMDAEERKKELMAQNEMQGLMFKMKDDPRITKVGKFIRKTSIDELPQFINVLKGDMSLVGTRPPTVNEFRQYQGHHKRRLSMKPGITGMWQAYGRSTVTDFEEIVKMDLDYIDHWSLGLDVKILCRTVVAVFQGG